MDVHGRVDSNEYSLLLEAHSEVSRLRKKLRSHARKDDQESQPITVNGKTYDVTAEISISH
jgi:hypothetical protein